MQKSIAQSRSVMRQRKEGRGVQKGAGKLRVGEPQEKRLYTEVGEVLKRFRNVVGTG